MGAITWDYFYLLSINLFIFGKFLAANGWMSHLLKESLLICWCVEFLIGVSLGWVLESNVPRFRGLGSLRFLEFGSCWNLHLIEVNSSDMVGLLGFKDERVLCWSDEIRISFVKTCLISFESELKSLKSFCNVLGSYFLSHALLGRRYTAPADILHFDLLPHLWEACILRVLRHMLPDIISLQLKWRPLL